MLRIACCAFCLASCSALASDEKHRGHARLAVEVDAGGLLRTEGDLQVRPQGRNLLTIREGTAIFGRRRRGGGFFKKIASGVKSTIDNVKSTIDKGINAAVCQARRLVPQPFPKNCGANGVLDLCGWYIIGTKSRVIAESCTIRAGKGTKIEIWSMAQLVFQKDIRLNGDITFRGLWFARQAPLVQARSFVEIWGSVSFLKCRVDYLAKGARKGPSGYSSCFEVYEALALNRAAASLKFDKCTASYAVLKAGELHLSQGILRFQRCTSRCARIWTVTQKGGDMTFHGCGSNTASGGGLSAHKLESTRGRLEFIRCRAHRGGGLAVSSLTLTRPAAGAGSVTFEDCYTSSEGGAIYVNSYDKSSTAIIEGHISIARCRSASPRGGMIYAAANSVSFKGVMPYIECPLGSRTVASTNNTAFLDLSCLACPIGQLHLDKDASKDCAFCPEGAEFCTPAQLRMRHGFMVLDVHDPEKNATSVCPNPEACKGMSPGRMCDLGYEGAGCAQCMAGHEVSDRSVLVCVACAETLAMQVLQVAVWVGKMVLIFALAVKSVLGSSGSAKPSGVHLNQLMSFSTLSSAILSAMLQTRVARQVKDDAVGSFFQGAAVILDMGSGQAGSGAGMGLSLQCSLGYFGLQPALWKGHLAFTALATAFAAALASSSGLQVAMVVGINCFLPEFVGHFGRYLVCYRLQENQGLQCPQAPAFTGGFALVFGCMLLCTGGVLYAWQGLYPSEDDGQHPPGSPDSASQPVHVSYLTAPYRETFAKWETERLLRKSCITLLSAALPITASPALQLVSLGSVVLASLVMYALLLPYKDNRWNLAEVALLTTCMVMIFAVFALLANDLHWGQSHLVQLLIIAFTTTLAVGICMALMFMTIRSLLHEHAAQASAKKALCRGIHHPRTPKPLPVVPPGIHPPGMTQPPVPAMPPGIHPAGMTQLPVPAVPPGIHPPGMTQPPVPAMSPGIHPAGMTQLPVPAVPPGIHPPGMTQPPVPDVPPGIRPPG